MPDERSPLLAVKQADEEALRAGKAGPSYTASDEPNIIGAASTVATRLAAHPTFKGLETSAEVYHDADHHDYYEEAMKSCGNDAIENAQQAFRSHTKPLALDASPTVFVSVEQDALVLAGMLWLILETLPRDVQPTQSVGQALQSATLAKHTREVVALAAVLILDAAASIMPLSDYAHTQGKDAIVEMLFKPLPLGESDLNASGASFANLTQA